MHTLIPSPLVVYVVLYGSFSAYPIIFTAHSLSQTQIGLTFLPIIVGFIILLGGTSLHFVRYRRLMQDAEKGRERRGIWKGKVEPEERLIPRRSL
jgi:DHA1 family multidrug resistance protein-like MFS transporter